MTRALLLGGTAALLLAGTVAATGGFDLRIAGISVRSHNPIPAAIAGAVLMAIALSRGRAALRDASIWFWELAEQRGSMLAVGVALAAIAVGSLSGTHIAGGSDSYCYLNQAELLARGKVRDVEPLATDAPWINRKWAFVPTGHVPAPARDGEFVPMCAAGYPLIMAGARHLAGRAGMFSVVPLMGALAVWLTFLLGRRLAGSRCGLIACVLLASSPTFLYQLVQPMTDVPAVALWTLAVIAASAARAESPGLRTAVLAGLTTGMALMVRPNLLPLAAVTGLMVARPPLAATVRTLMSFGIGLLPFVVAVAWFNNAMYGGPLKSGYGELGALFALDRVVPNLARYPVWLVRTETPFILLALAAPWIVRRRLTWWLLAFAAAVFVSYLAYDVFDAWWYLRFVLPAYPGLLTLASAVLLAGVARAAPALRAPIAAAAMLALVVFHLVTAARGDVFRLRGFEQRFRSGGEYVAKQLPPNAAVITLMQSGSVRFYSGRPALVWGALEPNELDRALDYLRARGQRPYLLFEGSEDQEFRKRFGAHSRIGSLEWPPMADIGRQVTIYDPLDYDRFVRGERIETQRVRIPNP